MELNLRMHADDLTAFVKVERFGTQLFSLLRDQPFYLFF